MQPMSGYLQGAMLDERMQAHGAQHKNVGHQVTLGEVQSDTLDSGPGAFTCGACLHVCE